MDLTNLFLCGMAWAQFGGEDAGRELIRALQAPNPQTRVLSRVMLEQAGERSKQLIGDALAQQEMSETAASLCSFEKATGCRWDREGWFPTASA